MNKMTRQLAEALTKDASDNGRVIEVGWLAMQLHVIPSDASEVQVNEMRKAFFMGAEHLWASIMTIIDPEATITERDLQRMNLINDELKAFRHEVATVHDGTQGGRAQ